MMQKNFKIERLDNKSCREIIGLILPIQQVEFNVDIDLAAQPDLLDIEKNYASTGGAFWGARLNGELIGTIGLIALPKFNTGAVRKMFVRKEYRGKELGVAQALLETLVTYCKDNNLNEIYLGTKDILQAACRFYERNGFKQVAVAELPQYFPRMAVDNVFYRLDSNFFIEENVIDSSGLLAISTRLQRLSDQIRKDGLLIYKVFGIDFQPKWFPVFYTLYKKSTMSVVSLSDEIGYAHPSTISLLKELEKEKFIRSKKDQVDTRKRLVELTEKGTTLLSSMEPVWDVIVKATAEVTNTENNLMKAINEVEAALKEKSFFERAEGYIKNQSLS